jgi:hypothetical protein
VSGEVARMSVMPAEESKIEVDFDVKKTWKVSRVGFFDARLWSAFAFGTLTLSISCRMYLTLPCSNVLGRLSVDV